MKILHLIQKKQLRGAEIFTCQLAQYQINSGHDVLIVYLFDGDAEMPVSEKLLIPLNGQKSKRWWDFKAYKALNKIISEFAPDIVQANAGDTLKYSVLSKLLHSWKQPICFRNASMVSNYINSPITKFINSFFYRYTNIIASVSKSSMEDLNNLFPSTTPKTKVIPIGLDIDKINFTPSKYETKQFNIIHVGGFTFEKNHEGLIRIFDRLLKKNNSHLHLIGDGPLRKKTEEKVEKLNLQQSVTFYGYVNNPLDYISGGDIFVLPSIIEGLPGVILEAMFCNIPVVAYDVGGIKEIIKEDITGKLIKKNDEETFVESIIILMNNPELRNKIVSNAKALIELKYNNYKISDEFISFYFKALNDDNKII
ncbi:glycosyltransferase [Mangrovivirga cuniculi]|uniref:Glycosyltransferase n=1 Tax=Mangrovivirga cuniculi TaxID=2715131 RepID=A0A4D7JQX9_9BACT|nr:glycosyltransferase [Mangrovivirga cuniculi]QCK15910.1 hypothetical protein DCC35_14765 [Mangrovivirga cuniculi]